MAAERRCRKDFKNLLGKSINIKKEKMNLVRTTYAIVMLVSITAVASAHDGKRIEILVQDDKIVGQGYLFSGDGMPSDDGGRITRPYQNAIHSHFTQVGSLPVYNNVTGFDLRESEPFDGADLILTLTGAGKWANPPAQDGTRLAQDFGTPQLSPLDPGENIEVGYEFQPDISTDSPGSFTLVSSVSGPATDIDLAPLVEFDPSGSIYYLEWTLSTTQPGISNSDSIYTILSPPGMGPVQRMHFQSLALERHLGVQATAVPEPGSLTSLVLVGLMIAARRKR